jgi:hypothetical protein
MFQSIVLCGDAGFVVSTAESSYPSTPLKWRDVNAVMPASATFTQLDVICLGFVTANVTIEVHEEMQGWSQMIEQLPSRLPGVALFADWWERVARPPFAPCATKLYERT